MPIGGDFEQEKVPDVVIGIPETQQIPPRPQPAQTDKAKEQSIPVAKPSPILKGDKGSGSSSAEKSGRVGIQGPLISAGRGRGNSSVLPNG